MCSKLKLSFRFNDKNHNIVPVRNQEKYINKRILKNQSLKTQKYFPHKKIEKLKKKTLFPLSYTKTLMGNRNLLKGYYLRLTANLILELLCARGAPEKILLLILYNIFHTAQPYF
jgi:hypothetical protein